MAAALPAEAPILVSAKRLLVFAQQALCGQGVPEDQAGLTAATLVEADRRGIHTHGMAYLPTYIARLQAGGINPRPRLEIGSDGPATAVIDGDNGLGQVVGVAAMDLAIAKARTAAVGVVGARNSNHFGAAGYYALRAAEAGMIGFAMSNIGPSMAPWGGATPCYGNNPIAYAVPAPAGPVVLDIATSVVSLGRIQAAAARGERIPEGWATDGDGNPTQDPAEVLRGGMLLPFGGHKGYGIALLVDILSGVLTGGAYGQGVGNLRPFDHPGRVGHFFAALDVARFIPAGEFAARMADMVATLKSARVAAGAAAVLAPGEMENVRAAAHPGHVALPPPVWQQCRALAGELGLAELL